MKTADLFKDRVVLSFEVFPPRKTSPVTTIYNTLDDLRDLQPDFISVTYGAGGGKNSDDTFKIAGYIKHDFKVESVTHLTCVGLTRDLALEKLKHLKEIGVENILALRGDLPPGEDLPGDFQHASDLAAFIREQGDFNVLGACYPEGHPAAPDLVQDIKNLRIKVDAGVSHLVSQLFFDNEKFYAFRERCDLAGINVPIEAGIMPVVNKKQIERMVSMCNATLPRKFKAILNRFEDKPEAMRDAGIAYAIDQIVDLVAQGVDGIHLYTMNNPYIARRIYQAVHNLMSR